MILWPQHALSCFFASVFFIWLCSCSGPELRILREETFFNNLDGQPENLHPIRSTDTYSSIVQSHILESLLQRNSNTYQWEPQLARHWSISPDGQTFTFELYDNLKWSDGQDLTTKDIEFSFLAYKNPKYGGIRYLSYFEKMDSVKILSRTKIQFKVKSPYFKNFQIIAGMDILPEHIYKDPQLKLSKTVIGSGPYVLDQYIRGKILVLRKNPLWRGKTLPENKNKWQFETIAFRFVGGEADIILRMEKNHIDFSYLSPATFFEKTTKAPWGTKIKKVQFSNKEPRGYSFIGFNLKKPIFQDRKVRKALAHLMNRELMNKKFSYGQREVARGPWYFWSDYADPSIPAIEFNPKKAIKILKSSGWNDQDQNGILEKTIKGQIRELSWTLIFSNPESTKHLTIYQEDLKKAGVKLSLKILDWASFLRLIDDKNFDAVMLGWGAGSIDFDPKQIWHSESAQKNGSNFISYSNPQVDRLIDQGRSHLDKKKRVKAFKEVYRLIAEDSPYIFMFHSRKRFYGLQKRVKSPAPALNYGLGMHYWSLRPSH